MSMGEEVLNRIQDLLVEIDKPKQKRKSKKERTSKTPPKPNRMYDYYWHQKNKEKQVLKELIKEEKNASNFKVENKKSIFINNQKQQKPIYERTYEILKKRERSLSKKRLEIQREKELQLLREEQEEFSQKQEKASQKKVDEIVNKLLQKERAKVLKKNKEKIQYLEEKWKENKKKPSINENSKKLWKKQQMNRSLSSNVLQRFERYAWEHQRRKQDLIVRQSERVIPFKPKISDKSRVIMERSPTNTPSFDRSLSCKCFRKKENSTAINSSRYIFTSRKLENEERDV